MSSGLGLLRSGGVVPRLRVCVCAHTRVCLTLLPGGGCCCWGLRSECLRANSGSTALWAKVLSVPHCLTSLLRIFDLALASDAQIDSENFL